MATVSYSALLAKLNGSKALKANDAAYQTIKELLQQLDQNQSITNTLINALVNGTDGPILTFQNARPLLPGSRQLIAGTNISFDDSIGDERIINASGSGPSSNSGNGPIFIDDGDKDDFPLVIPGPQGNVGSTGAQGAQGNSGIILLQDNYSPDDIIPIPGPQGLTGATGATGAAGPAGSSGGIVLPFEDSLTPDLLAITRGTDRKTRSIQFTIDNSGSVLNTGVAADNFVDYAGTIIASTLIADQSGSIVLDIWVTNSVTSIPTVVNTITASDLPTLSSTTGVQDITLTGWTISFAAGSRFRININSVTTVTRVQLTLTVLVT